MERFAKELVQILQDNVAPQMSVDVKEVVKVNDQKMHALNVMRPDEKVCTNFYIEEFYEQYQNGTSMERIVKSILQDVRKRHQVLQEQLWNEAADSVLDYQKVCDRVIMKLVGKERNHEYLKEKVFVDYLDLAACFCIYIGIMDDDCVSTTAVTKSIFECWNVSVDELYKKAIENMEKILPVVTEDILSVLNGLQENQDDDFGRFMNVPELPETEMFVMTNSRKVNGAAVILYPDALRKFAEEHEYRLLYIIPSSLHEVIIVPADHRLKRESEIEGLNEMLNAVNGEHVLPSDVLGDHIYVYEYETDTVSY